MLKSAVDIDKWGIKFYAQNKYGIDFQFEPNWAYNYLNKNDVLGLLLTVRKTKRRDVYLKLLEAAGKPEHSKQFECNARGQVVFKWATASEKTMFIMKWS